MLARRDCREVDFHSWHQVTDIVSVVLVGTAVVALLLPQILLAAAFVSGNQDSLRATM